MARGSTSERVLSVRVVGKDDSGAKTMRGLGDAADDAGSKIEHSSKRMAGAVAVGNLAADAAINIGRKLIDVGKQSVQAASDMNETVSKVGQIFGAQAAKQVEAFAKTADTAFGQSKQQALDAAAGFAVFGKAAGLQGDELVKFSTKLTGLASDMASFSNTTPQDAINALGSALRGEAEPIRRYGVLLDAASLQAEAVAAGIVKAEVSTGKLASAQSAAQTAAKAYQKAIKEHGEGSAEAATAQLKLEAASKRVQEAVEGKVPALTNEQKVLAANSLIYKQLGDAQGDFARTADGAANKARQLEAAQANLKTELGTGLLPLQLAVTDAMLAATKVIGPLAAGMVEKVSPAFQVAGKAVGDFVTDLSKAFTEGGISGLVGELVNQARDLAPKIVDGLKVVGQAVLDWVKTTAVDLARAVPQWADAFLGWAKEVGPKIVAGLRGVADGIAGWITTTGVDIARDIVKWTASFLSWYVDLRAKILEKLLDVAGAVIDWIGEQGPKYLSKLGEWTRVFTDWAGGAITKLVDALLREAGQIVTFVTEYSPTLLRALADWTKVLVEWAGTALVETVKALAVGATKLVDWVLEQSPKLQAAVGEWLTVLIDWAKDVFPKIVGKLLETVGVLVDWFAQNSGKITEGLASWLDAAVQWAGDLIPALITTLGKTIGDIFRWLGEHRTEIMSSLKTWTNAAIDWAIELPGKIVAELPGIIAAIAKFIVDEGPTILLELAKWSAVFVKWLTIDLPAHIIGKIASEAGKMLSWLGDLAKEIPGQLVEWTTKFVDWVTGLAAKAPEALAGFVTAIGQALLDKAKEAWEWFSNKLTLGLFENGGALSPRQTAIQQAQMANVQAGRPSGLTPAQVAEINAKYPETATTPGSGGQGVGDWSRQAQYTAGANTPRAVIIHSTEGSSLQGDLNELVTGGIDPKTGKPRKVSAHALIGKDGTIYRLVPDNVGANGAGFGTIPGLDGSPNTQSLQVELQHKGDEQYTPAQLAALKQLLAEWAGKYGTLPVYGHGEIDPSRRSDPTGPFPWNQFRTGGAGTPGTVYGPQMPVTTYGPPAPTSATTGRTNGERSVVYGPAVPGGQATTYAGGTVAWRNNNPGNLRYNNLAAAKAAGAIGIDDNGFAIFATLVAGQQAQEALLLGSGYKNLTIAKAIEKYAPASDGNDPAGYAAAVAKAAGVSTGTKIADLTPAQFQAMVTAMRSREGSKPGTVYGPQLPTGTPTASAGGAGGVSSPTPVVITTPTGEEWNPGNWLEKQRELEGNKAAVGGLAMSTEEFAKIVEKASELDPETKKAVDEWTKRIDDASKKTDQLGQTLTRTDGARDKAAANLAAVTADNATKIAQAKADLAETVSKYGAQSEQGRRALERLGEVQLAASKAEEAARGKFEEAAKEYNQALKDAGVQLPVQIAEGVSPVVDAARVAFDSAKGTLEATLAANATKIAEAQGQVDAAIKQFGADSKETQAAITNLATVQAEATKQEALARDKFAQSQVEYIGALSVSGQNIDAALAGHVENLASVTNTHAANLKQTHEDHSKNTLAIMKSATEGLSQGILDALTYLSQITGITVENLASMYRNGQVQGGAVGTGAPATMVTPSVGHGSANDPNGWWGGHNERTWGQTEYAKAKAWLDWLASENRTQDYDFWLARFESYGFKIPGHSAGVPATATPATPAPAATSPATTGPPPGSVITASGTTPGGFSSITPPQAATVRIGPLDYRPVQVAIINPTTGGVVGAAATTTGAGIAGAPVTGTGAPVTPGTGPTTGGTIPAPPPSAPTAVTSATIVRPGGSAGPATGVVPAAGSLNGGPANQANPAGTKPPDGAVRWVWGPQNASIVWLDALNGILRSDPVLVGAHTGGSNTVVSTSPATGVTATVVRPATVATAPATTTVATRPATSTGSSSSATATGVTFTLATPISVQIVGVASITQDQARDLANAIAVPMFEAIVRVARDNGVQLAGTR